MYTNKKNWHITHTKNLRKREVKRPQRLQRRRLGLRAEINKSASRKVIKIPKIMSLSKNYEETVSFINSIRKAVFEEDVFVLIDFSECKKISTDTCVILAAEIDRYVKRIPNSVTGTYPKNASVYYFMKELGFFNLLGVSSLSPDFKVFPNVEIVHLASGKDSPQNLMRGMKEIFYNEGDDRSQSPYSRKVYRALTEAMGNAIEHAYPLPFVEKNISTCVPIWWRSGFRINENNTIVMVLFDQGVGIPNSLVTTLKEKLEEFAHSFIRQPYDYEKIALAMEKGRSGTKVEGRGQGSYDMQKLIRENDGGELTILSYNGKYVYSSNEKWVSESLNTPLQGTLVIWKVCLDQEAKGV